MTEVGVGFGVALVAAAVTTPFSSHRMAASACAAMLAIGWAVAVVVSPYIEGPKDLLIYAALDVIFGVAVVHMLIDRPAVWKVALAFCFLTQLLTHAIFMTISFGRGFNAERLYRYQLAINIVLAVEIACVSFPGAWDVCRRLLDRVFRISGVRYFLGAGRSR